MTNQWFLAMTIIAALVLAAMLGAIWWQGGPEALADIFRKASGLT